MTSTTRAALAAKGVKIRSRDSAPVTVVGGPNDGGKGLYVEDPDGNGVEIIQLARPWPTEGGECRAPLRFACLPRGRGGHRARSRRGFAISPTGNRWDVPRRRTRWTMD